MGSKRNITSVPTPGYMGPSLNEVCDSLIDLCDPVAGELRIIGRGIVCDIF